METDPESKAQEASQPPEDNSDGMQTEADSATRETKSETSKGHDQIHGAESLERAVEESDQEWARRLTPEFLEKVPLEAIYSVLTPSAVGIYDLPLLKVLAWLIYTRKATVKPYVPIVQSLFKTVKESVALACLGEMVYIGSEFSRFHQSQRSYMSAILPLSHAAKKTSETKDHFNPIHTELFKHCILSKCYSAALPFLRDAPCLMSRDFQDNYAESLLLYFYYGGVIYLAIKDYQSACDTFSLVFVVPCSATSAIHIDCYKKLLLSSLILKGKAPIIPNCFPSMIAREVIESCKVYQDLVSAFSSIEKFNHVLQENSTIYHEDDNLGLVKQCLNAISKSKIQDLTRTYISLSISDIQSRANLPSEFETELRICEMVESGLLNAVIDQKNKAVLLKDHEEKYDTGATLALLDAQMRKVMHLAHLTKTCDNATMLSSEYAKTAVTQERFRTDDLYEEGYA